MLVILSPQWRHLSEATSPEWDYCLRTGGSRPPPLQPLAPTPEFAPNLRSPWKGVVGTGGISSSATAAATLALLGVSVEVVLLGGCAGCFGSRLPHPEARQKGFLGKQKETKYHTASPPWGSTEDVSLGPQRPEKPGFL